MLSPLAETAYSMEKTLSAALYIRLSKEDDRDGPSESVVNQRTMLEQYARECQFPVYDIYIDDGWSGCNFERPSFKRMLEDIEAKKVNLVITKDLSRLGRDYILTGHYLERYFPEQKVRYISLLDGIDTGENQFANEITPFRAIMNDLYARDISKKITAVKRDKQRRGEFIGGKAVYGYRKHPTEKNKLIIDEPSAAIVRQIFSMALHTDSCRAIAEALNGRGIASPSVYSNLSLTTVWSSERIREILQNEMYLGNMVQGRRIKASYKSKKCLRQREEDWIKVPNTHEPIIDRDTFQAVQHILSARKRTRERTYSHPLKGLIFCSECSRPLSLINRRGNTGCDTLYFLCRTGERNSGTHRCAKRCVKANTITDIVMSTLLSAYSNSINLSHLVHIANDSINRSLPDTSQDSTPLMLQIQQINHQIDRISTDMLNNVLNPLDYERLYRSLCEKRSALLSKMKEKNESQSVPDTTDTQELAQQFIRELPHNRELLSLLIERVDLTAERELNIVFRYAVEEPMME